MGRPLQQLQRFFRELKRRNVYKVAVTYAVVAFVTLQAAQLIFPATTLEGLYDKLVVLAFVGFPISLVLAWAFELTPEGVRRTAEAEPEEPGPAEGGTRTAYKVLIGLGLVGAAVAGGWYLTGGGGSDTEPRLGDRSIAVLPFEELGQEQPGTFTEGMHDDLLARLSNVSDLKVISRTAVQQYRDSEKTTGAIARELGVRWVLEGGVQEMGNGIQVNVQLIDPRTETHAWAETYQRDLTARDLFDLQGEISKRIAQSLEAELSRDEEDRVERRPTDDLDAYQLYVRGRTRLDDRTEESVSKAIGLFEQAIARDSTYGLAWTGLADALTLLAIYYGDAAADGAHARAMDAARTALELNPNLAEARASLGLLYLDGKNGPAAYRELTRAVRLRPSYARAYQWLANLEAVLGRPERTLSHARQAAELDPTSPSISTALAWAHLWVDGPSGIALEHARKAIALEPGYAHGHETEGLVLTTAGRQDEAIEAFQRAIERESEGSLAWAYAIGGLGTAYARSGDSARARSQRDLLRRRSDLPFQEGRVHGALNEVDRAFDRLDETAWTSVEVWAFRMLAVFDRLREDPRHDGLVRDIHLTWGLNPDGSLPEGVDVSVGSKAE